MGKSAALFAVAAAAVLWAGSGTAAQHFFAHSDRSALELSNIRMILAGLLLLPVAWETHGISRAAKKLRAKPRLAWDIFLYAAVGIFLRVQSGAAHEAAAINMVLSTKIHEILPSPRGEGKIL